MKMKKYTVGVFGYDEVTCGQPPLKRTCGHKHRSREAAQRCFDKLTRSTCLHGVGVGKQCKQCDNWIAQYYSEPLDWKDAEIIEL